MGATRDVALNELPIRGISINADGAGQSITVVSSDSGIIFINKEDAGNVTYTLPAVADGAGKWFWFYNAQTTGEIVITALTACIVSATSTYTSLTTSTNAIGDCGLLIGDGTYWYFFNFVGTWGGS
jgi:hypothetical protein